MAFQSLPCGSRYGSVVLNRPERFEHVVPSSCTIKVNGLTQHGHAT
jgi:hypothetical protein